MLGGDYRDTRDTFLALELIHNATLVHDDIIDDDMYRRGEPSLFSEHGVKKAVLTGDALLSMGLMYASRTGKPEIVEWLAETALKMVQGITLQNQYKRRLMSVDDYLYMNYLKSNDRGKKTEDLTQLFSDYGKRTDKNKRVKLSEEYPIGRIDFNMDKPSFPVLRNSMSLLTRRIKKGLSR